MYRPSLPEAPTMQTLGPAGPSASLPSCAASEVFRPTGIVVLLNVSSVCMHPHSRANRLAISRPSLQIHPGLTLYRPSGCSTGQGQIRSRVFEYAPVG